MTSNIFQLVLLGCALMVAAGGVAWSIVLPTHITEITGFCSLLAMSLLKMVMDVRAQARAEISRVALSGKMDDAASHALFSRAVQDSIHELVNSNMDAQLRVAAAALRRVAVLVFFAFFFRLFGFLDAAVEGPLADAHASGGNGFDDPV